MRPVLFLSNQAADGLCAEVALLQCGGSDPYSNTPVVRWLPRNRMIGQYDRAQR